MFVYLDSSVVLRVVFNEPNPLAEIASVRDAVSSDILRVECLRTADRYRVLGKLDEATYVERLQLIHKILDHVELVEVSPAVLLRASQAFPTQLGTLDAIHLSTLLLYRERFNAELPLATHDNELRRAAQALGIRTLG